jgi:hypothetical protein
MRTELLTPTETRRLVDELIRSHSFRISVGLYQAVLAQIESVAR